MISLMDYITVDNLKMLDHQKHTCLNEALNNSVAAFAPKNRFFSGTNSLEARVRMTAGINIKGHFLFWYEVLKQMRITMTKLLEAVLIKKDERLEKNRERCNLPSTKLKRSQKMRENIIDQLRQYREATAAGKTYGSGTAVEYKSAKAIVLKSLQENRKNNKIMSKDNKTYKYCPFFCDKTGHSTAADKRCCMKTKPQKEKKIASDNMEDLMIEQYLAEERASKFLLVQFVFIHLCIMHMIY